jgi:hypothetical protein
MTKAILAVTAMTIVGLVGSTAWYTVQARSADAAAMKYESWARDQKLVTIEFVVTVPTDAGWDDEPLYLSGSAPGLGAWDPQGVPLLRRADGKHHATAELMSGVEHTFRVNRGSPESVECGTSGAEIPLHRIVPGRSGTFELTLPPWTDQAP